ncbi:MAG: Diguanylate cyclase [Desulfonauticus sp. 38_4375]|nr:MAG: Diguanylate cyclase [Desulfonauticus sp. 38_4375]
MNKNNPLKPLKQAELLETLKNLGIVDNPNWTGLLLFIRNLIYYFSSLKEEQKANLQKKLLAFFAEKDFSLGKFFTALLVLENGLLENCREKLIQTQRRLEEEKKINSQIVAEIEDILNSLKNNFIPQNQQLKTFQDKTIATIEKNPNPRDLITFIKKEVTTIIENNQKEALKWEKKAKMLEEKARYDHLLDNLFNRSVFDRYIKETAPALIKSGRKLSLLMIDIDHFKSINDKWGHLIGDDVLRAAAKIIKSHADVSSGLACRYGGEEIAVILEDLNEKEAYLRAEALRLDINRYQFVPRQEDGKTTSPIHFSVSIGVAEVAPSDLPEDLIGKADKALYAAKSGGRNQVKCYSEIACDLKK